VCGSKLRVVDGLVLSLYLGFFLLMSCAAIVVGKLSRSAPSFDERGLLLGFFTVYIGGFVVLQRAIPHLLRLRVLKEGEKVKFPLEAIKQSRAEEAQILQEHLDRESPDVGKPSWVCPKCHEENPGNFDECWKCQTWRDQASGNLSVKKE
jgi:hypothetical protein